MLTVLETLGPVERAVFVLREVFDMPYDEIAEAVGKSAAAVRQIAHRAREHVRRAPAADVGEPRRAAGGGGAVPRRARRPATCRACSTCSRPTSCWSPTAAAWSPRRIRPLSGPKTVARHAGPLRRRSRRRARSRPTWLNGAPALRIDPGGELDSAVSLTVEGGRITRIYAIRNPHKLAGLDKVAVADQVALALTSDLKSPTGPRCVSLSGLTIELMLVI